MISANVPLVSPYQHHEVQAADRLNKAGNLETVGGRREKIPQGNITQVSNSVILSLTYCSQEIQNNPEDNRSLGIMQ